MKLLREVNLVQIQKKRLKIFVLFLPSSVKPISLCLCHHLSVEQLMGVVRVLSYTHTYLKTCHAFFRSISSY